MRMSWVSAAAAQGRSKVWKSGGGAKFAPTDEIGLTSSYGPCYMISVSIILRKVTLHSYHITFDDVHSYRLVQRQSSRTSQKEIISCYLAASLYIFDKHRIKVSLACDFNRQATMTTKVVQLSNLHCSFGICKGQTNKDRSTFFFMKLNNCRQFFCYCLWPIWQNIQKSVKTLTKDH